MIKRGPAPANPRKPDPPGQGLNQTANPTHHPTGGTSMKALKTVAVALGVTLAALIVIPLIVLAGLFVWLKLTEESDEETLELDQEGV